MDWILRFFLQWNTHFKIVDAKQCQNIACSIICKLCPKAKNAISLLIWGCIWFFFFLISVKYKKSIKSCRHHKSKSCNQNVRKVIYTCFNCELFQIVHIDICVKICAYIPEILLNVSFISKAYHFLMKIKHLKFLKCEKPVNCFSVDFRVVLEDTSDGPLSVWNSLRCRNTP